MYTHVNEYKYEYECTQIEATEACLCTHVCYTPNTRAPSCITHTPNTRALLVARTFHKSKILPLLAPRTNLTAYTQIGHTNLRFVKPFLHRRCTQTTRLDLCHLRCALHTFTPSHQRCVRCVGTGPIWLHVRACRASNLCLTFASQIGLPTHVPRRGNRCEGHSVRG